MRYSNIYQYILKMSKKKINSVQKGPSYTYLKFNKQNIIDLENKIKSNTNNNTFYYSEINKLALFDIFVNFKKQNENKNTANKNNMNYYVQCLWLELDGLVSTKKCINSSKFLIDLAELNDILDDLEESS